MMKRSEGGSYGSSLGKLYQSCLDEPVNHLGEVELSLGETVDHLGKTV